MIPEGFTGQYYPTLISIVDEMHCIFGSKRSEKIRGSSNGSVSPNLSILYSKQSCETQTFKKLENNRYFELEYTGTRALGFIQETKNYQYREFVQYRDPFVE